jgi:hypothetical protein
VIPLALINRSGAVLLRPDGTLPQITPGTGRPGLAVARAILTDLAVDAFLLVSRIPSTVCFARAQDDRQLRWGEAPAEIAPECQRLAVSEEYGGYRWYDRALEWLKDICAPTRIQQVNGHAGSILLRVDTRNGSLWFKAVSGWSEREGATAKLLATNYPGLFPAVLAYDPKHNWTLSEHVEGDELFRQDALAVWERTAEALAWMQIESLGRASGYLDAGAAADLRPQAIVVPALAFFETLPALMERQPRPQPAPLTRDQVRLTSEHVIDACRRAALLPFAETIANADFSPHNVVIQRGQPVFIDWAEAVIGFPFITCEYMRNRMVVETPSRASWREPIGRAYRAVWMERFSERDVNEAAAIVPLVAAISSAVFVRQNQPLADGGHDRYLRSLARFMHKHICASATEVLC